MRFPFSDLLPVGVCDFGSVSAYLLECRAKSRLPQAAKSIIVYLFPYYLGEAVYKSCNLSKYAVSKDYHIVAEEYLCKAKELLQKDYPAYSFEYFCDNSPIPEVKAAVNAGLGVKGENGLLINEKYGSFCFIGEIVTDMMIEPDAKNEGKCLQCGMCKKHCPSGALDEWGFCKELCFSHLTQKKGELPKAAIDYINKTKIIWGCDRCQDVCPMNKNAQITPIKEFLQTAEPVYTLTTDITDRAYSWRGKSVIDRNLKIMCCKDGENNL